MSISSINTNLAASLAQANIGNATTATSDNVAALSSGKRIVKASTDVAALSVGTALQSQQNTLTTSLTVASQGSSLLQVADGALAQIQSILQRQQAIATQAQSGSLSSTQLGFLDQEFQNLTSEIDQLSSTTNFNGVNLLNGDLTSSYSTAFKSTSATQASASYNITTNAVNNDTLTINGVTLTFSTTTIAGNTAANTIEVGATAAATAANIVNFINSVNSNPSGTAVNAGYSTASAAATSALSQVVAQQPVGSSSFSLTSRSGGTSGAGITLGVKTGTLVVATSGTQYTGASTSISNINLASTNSLIGSQVVGGLFVGNAITFNGVAVAGSTTTGSSTLASLVASINANTITSGTSAFISGSSGNYTLNLSNTAVGAANVTNAGALNTAGTTTLTSVAAGGADNGLLGISLATRVANTSITQTLTFHGLGNGAATVLTESNSSLKTGTIGNTINSVNATIANVTLGVTTVAGLFAQIQGVANYGTSTLTTAANGDQVITIINTATTNAVGDGLTGVVAGSATSALVNYGTRTADASFALAGATTVNNAGALTGGLDNGLGTGSVTATGNTGNAILVGQSQSASVATIAYPPTTDLLNNLGTATFTIGTGNAAVQFSYSSNANSSSATEIQIGSTLQQTLANAVAKINSYAANAGTGSQKFLFNQLTASSDGLSIKIATKVTGIATQLDITGSNGSTVPTVTASGNSAVVSGSLVNGSTGGVTTSNINNSAFTGNLSGLTATYNSANNVALSIKIGNYTYTANNVNTNPVTTAESVTLTSTDAAGKGGSFTIQLAANQGYSVSSAGDANLTTFTNSLNQGLNGITFYQTQGISSYAPVSGSNILVGGSSIGSLSGSSLSLTGSSFDSLSIRNVTVNAPTGGNTSGTITFNINGTDYTSSSNIGTTLAANTSYSLTSVSDPNSHITFKTGGSSIDFSTAANASGLQGALTSALGGGTGSALSFQVGSSTNSTIGVSIASASSSALFGGQVLNVASKASATIAFNQLTAAINGVTSIRANVGALEEQFNYATSAIQSAAQNVGAAQSSLLDTDVAATSSAFATSQVQLQAGIAVLAQANQLPQALLKLI
jgi:flagellin